MVTEAFRRVVRQRLADEVGRIEKQAAQRVALVYPSPYRVGMSSLGYQRVYRLIQELSGVAAERVFLPDEAEEGNGAFAPPASYESLRPLGDFPLLAFSVAYELELAGLVRMLDAAAIPAERERRDERHPLVIAGGPLTFSNPEPLLAFVDAVVMGEAEELVGPVVEAALSAGTRTAALEALARIPHVTVPAVHGAGRGTIAACDDALLPAWAPIRTPHTELSDMFLMEAERGCSRGCAYCVMRRSTNGGMRLVPMERLLALVPPEARKVGLVGAAVSDHPKIIELVTHLAQSGRTVGLSSLRPDRLKKPFVDALAAAGHRILTTALDGPSERLRESIERRGREPHYQAAAQHAREAGMERVKLYLMIGLPGETDADIDECVGFVTELSRIIPIALGISPFCPKRNTPLDGAPFAGVARVDARLDRLRRGLRGRAEVRATSARWAWVEAVLAQGGEAEGHALAAAVRAGGRYADYRRTFGALGHAPDGAGYEGVPARVPPQLRRVSLPRA